MAEYVTVRNRWPPASETMIPAIPARLGGLVAGQEPQADGYLRRVEQLPGQGDDAVDQVGLDTESGDEEADLELVAARMAGTAAAAAPAGTTRTLDTRAFSRWTWHDPDGCGSSEST